MQHSEAKLQMKDVQNSHDHRNIEIDKVGVKNVTYPITVLDKANGYQHTIATINMYVNLPHNYKGTHMSRFVEILHSKKSMINMKNLPDILRETKRKLHAEAAHLEVRFPYFIKKDAPVTGTPGYIEYSCGFVGHMDKDNVMRDFTVSVSVPITTLCPCSKEISDARRPQPAWRRNGQPQVQAVFLDRGFDLDHRRMLELRCILCSEEAG